MNRRCPRCRRKTMVPFGKIRVGPRKGLRKVFKCTGCGYQSLR